MTAVLSRIGARRLLRASGAPKLIERNLLVYRHVWGIFLSGFFEPVFYLLAIGVGIGQLVGEVVGPDGRPVAYAAFVAPAMLAASAMNGAVYESTMNIFFKLKYGKIYDAMLSTPLRPPDVAVGEIGWSLVRGAVYSVGFLIVMGAMGLIRSWWAVAALPGALLIGLAFGAAGMAVTTYMRSWQDLDLVTLVTLPMFLFSATFYPLDVYPPLIQVLTQLSPLYHGVVLLRALTLGAIEPSLLWNAGFLAAMALAGMAMASRRIARLLLT